MPSLSLCLPSSRRMVIMATLVLPAPVGAHSSTFSSLCTHVLYRRLWILHGNCESVTWRVDHSDALERRVHDFITTAIPIEGLEVREGGATVVGHVFDFDELLVVSERFGLGRRYANLLKALRKRNDRTRHETGSIIKGIWHTGACQRRNHTLPKRSTGRTRQVTNSSIYSRAHYRNYHVTNTITTHHRC